MRETIDEFFNVHLHFNNQISTLFLNRTLNRINRAFKSIYRSVLEGKKKRGKKCKSLIKKINPGAFRLIPTYLIRRIRTQHIQRRSDQLGLDRDRLTRLPFSSPQSLLDGIYPRRRITRQLDIRSKFDWLRSQTPCDG